MAAYPTQSARFADILLAVKARLQDQLLIGPSLVVLVKAGGYKLPYAAETHIRVRAVRGMYAGDDGGGRLAMPVTRTIAVDVFTRSAIDPAGEDDLALTEPDTGHYDREEQVAGALAIWWPMTTVTTLAGPPVEVPLTFEPLHPIDVPQDADAPDQERYNGYLSSTVYFEAKYVAKLLR